MIALDEPLLLPLSGLAVGAIIGFAARSARFCTLAAIERYWYGGDSGGLRGWALLTATATLATMALALSGVIDITSTHFASAPFNPIAVLVGATAFGFGMALVGTCGFGAAVQLGGGSLRHLVVIVIIALAGLSMQFGALANMRLALFEPLAITGGGMGGLVDWLEPVVGRTGGLVVGLVIAAAVAVWALSGRALREQPRLLAASLVIGFAVAAGWWITTFLADRSMHPQPMESASFIAPFGELVMSLALTIGRAPGYAAGLALGVVVGAAIAAVRWDDVRWEACDDARELGRHLVGASLMGAGGVLALGCTIGQGVTGFTVLAISAPIALAGFIIGARMGLAMLIEGSVFQAFAATRRREPQAGE
ncbi:MAG: YeeE/YedE family protein [Rhizobiales bacterium]|nr:YeeE/YedE family protein [Hyphomicrobiales bacterium]